MALNAIERELLEQARAEIRADREEYICHALEVSAERKLDRVDDDLERRSIKKAEARLSRYVLEQIRPCIFFHNWQRERSLFVSREQSQIDRVNWISWMLGEL